MPLDIISKHRNVIYGFSIIWIVIFHAAAINGVDYSFGNSSLVHIKKLIGIGNVGVDMFLFLSGVCLYFSFTRNNDVIRFLKRRFTRIVPAVLLVDGLYWLIKLGVMTHDPVGLLSRLTLIRFWMTGDQAIWFVSLILVLYLLFPTLYMFLFDKAARYRGVFRLITLLVFTYATIVLLWQSNNDLYSMVEIAITRIPVFIFGTWFGQFVYEGKRVPIQAIAIPFALCLIFYLILWFDLPHGPMKRFSYFLGGVSFSYAIAIVCWGFDQFSNASERPLNRFFAWTGGFSLELYITHITLNQILRSLSMYERGNLAQYAVVAICAFVLAWIVKKVIDAVANKRADRAIRSV